MLITNARKDAGFRNSTRDPSFDGYPQGTQFFFLFLFVSLQES
jgi:hypothetical protein